MKFINKIKTGFIRETQVTYRRLGVVCGLSAAFIFLVDILIPKGFTIGVLYAGVILLSQWSSSKKFILINALGCSCLNFLGFFFSPSGFDMMIAFSNRILAFFAIWVAAILSVNREGIIKTKEADILEQKNVWETLSKIDELTGISNRRNYEEYIEREWRRSVRDSSPISLIMVDIDLFKNYNDFYGHLKGDECLKRIAETLNNTLKRPGDLVGRYGGEEFIVVLPNTGEGGAKIISELLRRKVEALEIPHLKSSVKPFVTISLGISTCIPNQIPSYEFLTVAADQALYQAKQEGRNRVVVLPAAQSESLPDPEICRKAFNDYD